MEDKKTSEKENGQNSINEQPNPDYDEKIIFCPLCKQYPEYSIKFISISDFVLEHSCIEKKVIKNSFDLEKDKKPMTFICYYCKKECNHLCIKCKYLICEECAKEHNKIPYAITEEIAEELNNDNESVFSIINSQYSCDKHLLKYKFYCPFCKVNLCQNCKDEHFHINCPSLFNNKFIFKNIKEPSSDCFKKLFNLAKIFYSCYNKNVSCDLMTLNILLNANLADNIINYIQNNLTNEEAQIKNQFRI